MDNLHKKLTKKYRWYNSWHKHPKLETMQWLVLFLVVASLALLFVNRIRTPIDERQLDSMKSHADFSNLPDSAYDCLQRTSPRLNLTGVQQNAYFNNGMAMDTVLNSKTASWTGSLQKPFRVGGGSNLCVAGGTITGTFPLSTTWSTMHDTYAFEILGPNALIERLWIHNYGDGVAMWDNANNFSVKKVHMSQIRDDCISNDNGWSGLLEDSFLDGCYVAFSDRSWAAAAPDAVWTIRNNVVRLQSYENTYRPGVPGHGWFWKMDFGDAAVKIDLHGNVFRADEASIHDNHVFRADKIVSCKKPDGTPDNIIVWGGTGPYPRPEELTSGCFTLTTDLAVWNAAVTAWTNRTSGTGTLPDTTPPTVTMSTPLNNTTVSGSAVPIVATASDNVGVVGVQFKLNGNNIGSEDLTAPYSTTFDSTTLPSPSGNYVIAIARDAAGNTTSKTVLVTVNNAPMQITTQSMPSVQIGQSYTYAFANSGGQGPFTWAAIVSNGVTGYQINPTTGVFTATVNRTGNFKVVISLTDSAGHTASNRYTWTILP